jgi:hypothetical protein
LYTGLHFLPSATNISALQDDPSEELWTLELCTTRESDTCAPRSVWKQQNNTNTAETAFFYEQNRVVPVFRVVPLTSY